MRFALASSRVREALVTLVIGWLAVVAAPGKARADVVLDLGRGPVTVHVPPTYDPAQPAPLVMFLHGYGPGITGAIHESYMGILPWSDELGFLYVYPDGTADQEGILFWNATDACCDFYGSGVDDSGYLRSLIEAIVAELNVDTDRVFVFGHSNGGFMAYRMACDHADLVAGVASLAGATWTDPAMCSPSEAVNVLQIHGTADDTVSYYGGDELDGHPAVYPGAVETTEAWAAHNGCSTVPDLSWPPLDLSDGVPGFETAVARYAEGCEPGGTTELWAITGGGHIPDLSPDFVPHVLDFFLSGGQGGALLLNRSFIPAAAYAGGAEGAFFQTDVDAVNSGDTAGRYRFLWLPRGEGNDEPVASAELTLGPGVGARYVNVVRDVFGLEPDAVGAIAIEASSPNLLFASRTYTLDSTGSGGTFGQSMPAVAARDMLLGTRPHHIVFGTESSAYRTNIGCLNAAHSATVVDVELRDQAGHSLATTMMVLRGWSNDQLNRVFADFRPVRGTVVVSSRRAGAPYVCYGSVLDNLTSDPTTILPQRGGY